MPSFSKSSITKLVTCSKNLQDLFKEVVKNFDCTIVEGYRDEETQNRYYREGKTQVRYPNSNHNILMSHAVDVVPYLRGIDWRAESDLQKSIREGKFDKDILHNIERWMYFVGYVMGTADQMGIKIRWGGDWDMDKELADNNFDDWPHFEEIVD